MDNKIIFTFPPRKTYDNLIQNGHYFYGYNVGVYYIAAHLREHDIQADIGCTECESDMDYTQLYAQIKNQNYPVVNISYNQGRFTPAIKSFVNQLKKDFPHIFIVVGGHFATFAYREILTQIANIDAVVIGEGEEPMLELLQNLHQPQFADGIALRINGQILEPRPGKRLTDLDSLPFPVADFMRVNPQIEYVPIVSVRGCYGNCSFCQMPAYYKRQIYRKSAKTVVDEMEIYALQYGKRNFRFFDYNTLDSSNTSLQWIDDFKNELQKRQLSVHFNMQLRVNDCIREVIEPLLEIGLEQLNLGIENFNDTVLQRFKKGINMKQIISALHLLHGYNIKIKAYFINFEPDMSFAELKKNVRYMTMFNLADIDCLYNYCKPDFGTPMRKKLLEEGRIKTENWYDTGIYVFNDPQVQLIFDVLIYHNESVIHALESHMVDTRMKYRPLSAAYLTLPYEDRVTLRSDILTIKEYDKKIWQLYRNKLTNIFTEALQFAEEKRQEEEKTAYIQHFSYRFSQLSVESKLLYEIITPSINRVAERVHYGNK